MLPGWANFGDRMPFCKKFIAKAGGGHIYARLWYIYVHYINDHVILYEVGKRSLVNKCKVVIVYWICIRFPMHTSILEKLGVPKSFEEKDE